MRSSPLSLGLAALILAGPLACEPATPPAAPPPPSPAPSASVASVASGPAYDLSPVAEPSDLVGVLRVKNPAAALTTLSGCAGLPPELAAEGERGALMGLFRRGLRGQIDAQKLTETVAMDAPLDVVATLDPSGKRAQPNFAFAFGLSSLEGARAAIVTSGSPVEIVPGMWRVGDKERRDVTCVIAVSTGPTPGRFICGQREKDLIALAPYMTRTLPTVAPAPTDLHAEVRWAPIDERYGAMVRQSALGLPIIAQSQASIGDPVFDRALTDAASALSDEAVALTRDLDRLTLDVSTDPSVCLTTSVALKLRDKTSWLAGFMLDRPDRAGPPPSIFWRAPKDSDYAVFSRNDDPARLTGIIKTLRTLIDSGLGKLQVGSPDDRRALADLVATPFSKDANIVDAHGHNDASRSKASKSNTDERTSQQAVDDVIAGFGWVLEGVDEGPEALTKWLKDVVAVYGRKGLSGPLKKGLSGDARYLPTLRLVAAPAALGKGALDVEVKLDIAPEKPAAAPKGRQSAPPPPAKQERVTFTLHLLLMPDGKNTWLAFGGNRDELVKHLLMTKTTAPESDSLASRPGLEPLRGGKNMSAGFFSLTWVAKLAELSLINTRSTGDLAALVSALQSMPHKGETPIFIATTVTAGNAPQTEVTMKLLKSSFEDLGALLVNLMRPSSTNGTQMPPPQRQP